MRLLRTIVLVIVMLLCIPRVVHAQAFGSVYFYENQDNGEYREIKRNVVFEEEADTAKKAEVLMDRLFLNEDDCLTGVPEGTKLLWTNYFEGRLIVNLSGEINNLTGSYDTELFLGQFVKTAYSLKEIRCIILYADGEETALPEGIDFSAYNR